MLFKFLKHYCIFKFNFNPIKLEKDNKLHSKLLCTNLQAIKNSYTRELYEILENYNITWTQIQVQHDLYHVSKRGIIRLEITTKLGRLQSFYKTLLYH